MADIVSLLLATPRGNRIVFALLHLLERQAIRIAAGYVRPIHQRILVREKSRAKAQFLRAVFDLPCAGQLVLRGGSALHGVYLHRRWSEDTDFFAPPELARDFAGIAREHGIALEDREPGITPIYVTKGVTIERVEVAYDMIPAHYPEETFLVPQVQTFRALSGETAQVRTYSLSGLLARKLRYVVRRRYAVDFYDLWVGLRDHPECAAEMQSIVTRREMPVNGIVPHEIYKASVALNALETIAPTWESELAPLMASVPPFAQVRIDLQSWLPPLEADPPRLPNREE